MRGGEGAEVVFSLKNDSTFANLILDKIGSKGQIKRKVYQRRLPENPNKDYYYILRETDVTEPVLVEYGFIDNVKDAAKLKRDALLYAEGVVEAICEYLGYPYSANTEQTSQETYIVQKGDTLYSISKRFQIPISDLKRINNLETDTLTIGQVLYLKDKEEEETPLPGPIPGTYYTVEKGDTLYSISRKFNTSIEDIIEANSLTTNTLSIGQQLYIPGVGETISPPTTPEPFPSDYDVYVVQKGDSLWLISQKYNISVPDLIELNNLTNLTLQIGQKLLVPKKNIPPEESSNIYIVEPGDTLWSVSKKFNLTVEELKRLNGLENNLLSVGQELIVA